MKKILILMLVTLSLGTWSFESQIYIITTKDKGAIQKIQNSAKFSFSRGRLHLVSFSTKNDAERFSKYIKQISTNSLYQKIYFDNDNDTLRKLGKITTNEDTKNILSKLNVSNYENLVSTINNLDSRSIAGLNKEKNSGNEKTTKFIDSYYKSLGYESKILCYRKAKFYDECNVAAYKQGKTNRTVLVVGHFDTVGKPRAGADDNASGAAGVLEIARVLKDVPTNNSILFLSVNGEEENLNGSTAFASNDFNLSQISYVIVMDMIAYSKTNTAQKIVDIETNKPFLNFAEKISKIALTYTTLTPRITTPAWGSDHEPFLNRNIPSYLSIENWDNHTPCYHKECDLMNTLNINYAMEILKMNTATLLELEM